jgi:hypothetical protein
MDATKIKHTEPTPSAQPVKRNPAAQPAHAEAKPQKSPYDQPRPTTNAQGQKIGTLINHAA